jgi:hypothetical protein
MRTFSETHVKPLIVPGVKATPTPTPAAATAAIKWYCEHGPPAYLKNGLCRRRLSEWHAMRSVISKLKSALRAASYEGEAAALDFGTVGWWPDRRYRD